MQYRVNFRIFKARLLQGLVIFFAFSIMIPLLAILYYILRQGLPRINWTFLTHIPQPVGESGGGIANALVGSLIIVFTAAVMAIPIGIMAGIYLSENRRSRLAYWGGLCVDILQGIPSIVVGIVIYFWLVKPLGGFSAFSGSAALAIMMLPIVIRSTEETLKLLPSSLKESGLALGVPYHRVILKVVVPCGMSGIISGVLLSVARIAGETAPLLFTAFGNPYLSTNITKPMHSLPLLIFDYATSAYKQWHDLAWGASAILLIWVLLLNIITKLTTKRWNLQL